MINIAYSQYSMCHLSLHHQLHVAFGNYGGWTILKGHSLKRIFHSHSERRTSLRCLSYTAESRMPTDAPRPQTDPPHQAKMFTELSKTHHRELGRENLHSHYFIRSFVHLVPFPAPNCGSQQPSEEGQPVGDAVSKGTCGPSPPEDAKCLTPHHHSDLSIQHKGVKYWRKGTVKGERKTNKQVSKEQPQGRILKGNLFFSQDPSTLSAAGLICSS